VFLARDIEIVDHRAIIRAADPTVSRPKFEFGDGGLFFDGINRAE
jgi:hypothetical protein